MAAEGAEILSPPPWTFGVGFATFFEHPIRRRLPRLRYAYRAPSLAVGELTRAGHRLRYLDFDEGLTAEKLDQMSSEVDLLYLSTHGGPSNNGYEAALTPEGARWTGLPQRLGHGGPRVVVFDSCDLIRWTGLGWDLPWNHDEVGLDLRLILGFCSQASISPETSGRATAFFRFALSGMPLAAAWLQAVSENSWPGLDSPVAIALGDDKSDARAVAHRATLDDFPAPRTVPAPAVQVLPGGSS